MQFREVGGNAKQALHIANQEAGHAKSMKILHDNGLRPLTYPEAFTRSSELITELKGKWFYLDGQGPEKGGIYTFNNKGELTELTGNETLDQKVRVYSGNTPLSLGVYSDYVARDVGRRFDLVGVSSPDSIAPVVVGVKQAQAGSVAAAPQTGKSVAPLDKKTVKAARREFNAQVVKNPAIDASAFTAVQKLLKAAEHQ